MASNSSVPRRLALGRGDVDPVGDAILVNELNACFSALVVPVETSVASPACGVRSAGRKMKYVAVSVISDARFLDVIAYCMCLMLVEPIVVFCEEWQACCRASDSGNPTGPAAHK